MSTMFSSKSSGSAVLVRLPRRPLPWPPEPAPEPEELVVVRLAMPLFCRPDRLHARAARRRAGLRRREPAVDADDLAGDIGAGRAGQEDGRAGEVAGQAVAADHRPV